MIINDLQAQKSMNLYYRLERGAINEIDAAMFSGDMFALQSNRADFIAMMDRWTKQLKVWEEISNG